MVDPVVVKCQYPLIYYLDFPKVLVEMKMSEEEVYQIEEWIEETKIMKFRNQRKGNENEKDFCKHWQILNKLNKGKVDKI